MRADDAIWSVLALALLLLGAGMDRLHAAMDPLVILGYVPLFPRAMLGGIPPTEGRPDGVGPSREPPPQEPHLGRLPGSPHRGSRGPRVPTRALTLFGIVFGLVSFGTESRANREKEQA